MIGAADDPTLLSEHITVGIERERPVVERDEDEAAARRERSERRRARCGRPCEVESDIDATSAREIRHLPFQSFPRHIDRFGS